MKIEFMALVKDAGKKALVSGDSSYEIKLRGEDSEMAKLAFTPSDRQVKVSIEWNEAE